MQYQYRQIMDSTLNMVSFAVAKPSGGCGLWSMRNFYNGDIRTENRESQMNVGLEVVTLQDLPKTVRAKVGLMQFGAVETTPDLPDTFALGNYLRELAGLPPYQTPQYILERRERDKNPD